MSLARWRRMHHAYSVRLSPQLKLDGTTNACPARSLPTFPPGLPASCDLPTLVPSQPGCLLSVCCSARFLSLPMPASCAPNRGPPAPPLSCRQHQAAQQPNGTASRTPSRKLSHLHSTGSSSSMGLDQHQQQPVGLSRTSASSVRRLASSSTGRSTDGVEAALPGGRPPMPPPQPGQSPPRELRQQSRVAALRGSRSNASIPDSAASLDSDGSGKLLEAAAATAANAEPRLQGPAQPLAVAAQQVAGKDKGKSAALRFLSRLGSRKEKYKAKERGVGLQVGPASGSHMLE